MTWNRIITVSSLFGAALAAWICLSLAPAPMPRALYREAVSAAHLCAAEVLQSVRSPDASRVAEVGMFHCMLSTGDLEVRVRRSGVLGWLEGPERIAALDLRHTYREIGRPRLDPTSVMSLRWTANDVLEVSTPISPDFRATSLLQPVRVVFLQAGGQGGETAPGSTVREGLMVLAVPAWLALTAVFGWAILRESRRKARKRAPAAT